MSALDTLTNDQYDALVGRCDRARNALKSIRNMCAPVPDETVEDIDEFLDQIIWMATEGLADSPAFHLKAAEGSASDAIDKVEANIGRAFGDAHSAVDAYAEGVAQGIRNVMDRMNRGVQG